MFSDLNKVTQKIPNARDPRAKQTDTREEIRRHDPEHERKKGEHRKLAQEQGIFGEDQTEVSVQSLEAFLPMLLKNYAGSETATDKIQTTPKVDQSNPSAKAAGAYAKMAQYSPSQNETDLNALDNEDEMENIDHPKLSKVEVQAIHRLQADVAKLKARNVSVIYINKAGTFLESLQNGVQEALNSSDA